MSLATVYTFGDANDACLVGTASETQAMRDHLTHALRPGYDSAVLLPGASKSACSMTYKNVAFTLDGRKEGVPVEIFSEDWGHGASAMRVPQTSWRPQHGLMISRHRWPICWPCNSGRKAKLSSSNSKCRNFKHSNSSRRARS